MVRTRELAAVCMSGTLALAVVVTAGCRKDKAGRAAAPEKGHPAETGHRSQRKHATGGAKKAEKRGEKRRDEHAETERDKHAETERDKHAETERDKHAETERDKRAETERDKRAGPAKGATKAETKGEGEIAPGAGAETGPAVKVDAATGEKVEKKVEKKAGKKADDRAGDLGGARADAAKGARIPRVAAAVEPPSPATPEPGLSGVLPKGRGTPAPVVLTRAIRPPEPPLDVTGYLSAADIERVLGKKRHFRRAELPGIKPSKGYNALYYRPAKGGDFGVGVQVWRDRSLVDSRTRFNAMRNTYNDVVPTNKIAELGFRAYFGGVVSLIFADPRRPLVASVSCSTKFCTPDAILEFSKRVRDRLR